MAAASHWNDDNDNDNDNNNNNNNNNEDISNYHIWNGRIFLDPNQNHITTTTTTTITCVVVMDHVSVIISEAFSGCFNLRQVHFPFQNNNNDNNNNDNNKLMKLDASCFAGCKSLKQICLPNSVQQLCHWSFHGSGLEMIHIPPKVTEIDAGVFCGCQSLSRVMLHDNIQQIHHCSFVDCTSLKLIQFTHSSASASAASLRRIGYRAFAGSGLEEIHLPPNVNLDECSFENCKQLSKVVFPHSRCGRIENNAFRGCHNVCIIQFTKPTTTTTRTTTTFTIVEQKLISELCRTTTTTTDNNNNNNNNGDVVSTTTTTTTATTIMDRLGIGWNWMKQQWRSEKDQTSTIQTTCLFSFLKHNVDCLVGIK